MATRFNNIYGDVFKIPEPYIPKVGARVMSLVSPENKMSKSDKDPNGTVYLLDQPDVIMRKFKKKPSQTPTPSAACAMIWRTNPACRTS